MFIIVHFGAGVVNLTSYLLVNCCVRADGQNE